jgi:transcriptional regulator with XRE-family HTH domain
MGSNELRTARAGKGLTQAQAADRLGVSQAYVAMLENGKRPLTRELARRVTRLYGLAATAVPPAESLAESKGPTELAQDLAALGYPGFAYMRPRRWAPKNPGEVLLAALAQEDLEARLVEALPWLVRSFTLDREWLVHTAKVHDLQNRLGFVVTLARRLVERAGDENKTQALRQIEADLERSRLARQDTLCRASLSKPEQRWLAETRPEDAKRWNLLTDWTADALRYTTT